MNKFTKLFKGGNKNPSFDDSAEKIWDKSDNSGFEQSKLKYLEWKSDWDSYWVKCPKLLRVS